MSDQLESVNVACAVTALEVLGFEYLMAGCGPYIHVYPLRRAGKEADEVADFLHRERIFHSEVVHRIVVRKAFADRASGLSHFELVVVGKSLVNLYSVQCSSATPGIAFFLVNRIRAEEGQGLVLDAFFLGDLYVILGLGSNEVSVHHKASGAEVARYQSSARSGLFSMAIDFPSDGISDQIRIASGTAFGSIFIWDVDISNIAGGQMHPCGKFEPSHILSGHEGFVFKLRWSTCGEWLASGSDDRSVRVWHAGSRGQRMARAEQVFVGWGHTCRVWDVLFIRESLLASSSEDLTVRIWDYKRNCSISTIFAHVGRHVWCIAYNPACDCVYSGGNDSSIKVWNVELSMYVSRDSQAPPSLYTNEFAIAHDINGSNSSQAVSGDVIIAIKMSPYSEDVILVYASGQIATCSLVHNQDAVFVRLLSDVLWGPTVRIESDTLANAAAIQFVEDSNLRAHYTVLGLYNGCAVLAFISSYEVTWRQSWKAHNYKISGVWIANCDKNSLHVFTASVGGEVKLWRISADSTAGVFTIDVQLVVYVTNAKKQMASACLLLQSGCIVVGGCKGCLSYFDYRSIEAYKDVNGGSGGAQGLDPTFTRMHSMGTSPIAEIVECRAGFIVSGHDGHVNVYVITPLHEFRISQTLSTSSISISDNFYLPSSYEPIRNDSISGGRVEKLKPFIIGGFQSSTFEIWDISAKYCLMRVNGGGWRRLHSCTIRSPRASTLCSTESALPDASFVSIDATGKVPVLKAYSYRGFVKTDYKGSMIKSFGKASNGRVMYTGAFITVSDHECRRSNPTAIGGLTSHDNVYRAKQLFVGAGEEGVIKLYDIPSLDIVQEVLFPGSSLVRSISTVTMPDGTGVLVVAGGRLAHAVWSFRSIAPPDRKNVATSDASIALYMHSGFPSALGSVLHREYIHDPAAEHRGLCSACWSDGSSTNSCDYIIGDSRGVVRLFRFVKSLYSATLLHEFIVSECPVLCCKVIVVPSSATSEQRPITIAFFGDTAGFMYIYRLNSDRKETVLMHRCKIQMMGTDALEVAVLRSIFDDVTGDRVVEIVAFTGGDDQSVGIILTELRISAADVQGYILAAVRVDGVCGSAVHALSILRINASHALVDIACASLDQRLYFWQCDLAKTTERYKLPTSEREAEDQTSCPIAASCNAYSQSSPLKWRSGDVLHTADVGAMGIAFAPGIGQNSYQGSKKNLVTIVASNDSNTEHSSDKSMTDDSYCVVVGEGIQVFKYRLGPSI